MSINVRRLSTLAVLLFVAGAFLYAFAGTMRGGYASSAAACQPPSNRSRRR